MTTTAHPSIVQARAWLEGRYDSLMDQLEAGVPPRWLQGEAEAFWAGLAGYCRIVERIGEPDAREYAQGGMFDGGAGD